MGLAQAVSLPRGGGTLKGQRPLPAASGPLPSSPTPTPSLSGHLDPFPRGDQQPKPGSGREGARRLARRWRGPRGCGARAEGTRRAGSQAASRAGAAGARRALCQERGAAMRRERRESQEEKDKEEKERVAGTHWVPGASSQDDA